MNYTLQRGKGTVYDTLSEAKAAVRDAYPPDWEGEVRIRYHPDWMGYCVNVILPEQTDLYLVEQGT